MWGDRDIRGQGHPPGPFVNLKSPPCESDRCEIQVDTAGGARSRAALGAPASDVWPLTLKRRLPLIIWIRLQVRLFEIGHGRASGFPADGYSYDSLRYSPGQNLSGRGTRSRGTGLMTFTTRGSWARAATWTWPRGSGWGSYYNPTPEAGVREEVGTSLRGTAFERSRVGAVPRNYPSSGKTGLQC